MAQNRATGTSKSNENYSKHYIPLESNPQLFTELIRKLGVSTAISFQDVLSMNDSALLELIPRPALALVLVFPTSHVYEQYVEIDEDPRKPYAKSGDQEDAIWFKQTINNACGLYSILHAVSNGPARNFIGNILG